MEAGVATGVGGKFRLGPVSGEAQGFNMQVGANPTGDVTAVFSAGAKLEVGPVQVGLFLEIEVYPNPSVGGVPGVAVGGDVAGQTDLSAVGVEFSRPGGYLAAEVSPKGLLERAAGFITRTENWLRDKIITGAPIRQ